MAWLAGWENRKESSLSAGGSIAGTVTVTNGSAAVVGTDTFFTQWGIGDHIQLPDTNWYTILTITDNTHLAISVNYPGANASDQAYDMRIIDYQKIIYVAESSTFSSPGMTSNTTPAPYVTSAKTNAASYPAYRAMDGNAGTAWESGGGGPNNEWFKLYCPAAACVTTLTIRNKFNYGYEDFKLQGSNDDVNWTDIYSDTCADSGDVQTFNFSNTTYYSYNRVFCVSGYNASQLMVYEITMAGTQFGCDELGATDFDDLRFTNSDGETLLDYWIDSISGATPNQLATIWLKYDRIDTNATSFYQYFGNAGASAVSSGANTFIQFDDFEYGVDGDNASGYCVETGAHAHVSTDHAYGGTRCLKIIGNGGYPYTDATLSPVTRLYEIRVRVWKETATAILIQHGSTTHTADLRVAATEAVTAHPSTTSLAVLTADTWQEFVLNDFDFTAHTYDIYMNGPLIKDGAAMNTTNTNAVFRLVINASSAGNDSYFDNVIITKWEPTELVREVWGILENIGNPIPACYLHARRDRLDTKGVSTQNQLA